MRTLLPLLLPLLLSFACAGCFTMSTAQVTVRDTTQVTLEKAGGEKEGGENEGGEPLLSAGPGPERSTSIEQGTYWHFFESIPYDIWADRQGGQITLQCPACAAGGYEHVPLTTPDGKLREVFGFNVDIGTDKVTTKIDECLVSGSHGFCHARAQANLVAPMSDVVEVRRKQTPIRFIGYVLAVVGGAALTAAAVYTFKPSPGESIGDRAPFGALAAAPFGFAFGLGLWEIFSPVHETVWHPSPPAQ